MQIFTAVLWLSFNAEPNRSFWSDEFREPLSGPLKDATETGALRGVGA